MRHQPRFSLLLLLSLFAFGSVFSQSEAATSVMDLEAAIAYAQEKSTAVRNARIQIADAEQQIKESLSTGLPNINGSLDYTHYLKVPVLPLPEAFASTVPPGQEVPDGIAFQLRNNFVAGISANTMIFNGSFFVALKASREARKFYELELQNQQRVVRNQVINTYLPLLLIKQSIEQLGLNIQNLTTLRDETAAFYEAGFVEQLDVDRLSLSLDNLQVERENLQSQRENALRALKYTLNYPLNEPLTIDDDLEEISVEADNDLMLSAVPYQDRPELRVLDQSLVLQNLAVELEQAAYLPSVNATLAGQYQFQGDKISDGFWAPTVLVGLSANIPIWDFGGRKARVQQARLDKEVILNQRNDLVRGIELEVTNAREDFNSAQRRLGSRLRSRELAERIYETTQIKYKEGVGSSLEVAQAEQELYTAQNNYLNALYETLLAKESLKQALGQ
jgi:outer membrane protein TolC